MSNIVQAPPKQIRQPPPNGVPMQAKPEQAMRPIQSTPQQQKHPVNAAPAKPAQNMPVAKIHAQGPPTSSQQPKVSSYGDYYNQGLDEVVLHEAAPVKPAATHKPAFVDLPKAKPIPPTPSAPKPVPKQKELPKGHSHSVTAQDEALAKSTTMFGT